MAKLIEKMTPSFNSFIPTVCLHPKKVIAAIFVFVAVLMTQLPSLKIESSTESLFHEQDPVLLKYRAFQDQFGRDDIIIVGINPPEVFDFTFLEKLKNFHKDLEKKVPNVKDVTSLLNARSTYGREDELVVEDLLEEWPQDVHDLQKLKERVLSNPLYINTLVSKDGRFTTVVLEPYTYSSSLPKWKEEVSGKPEDDFLAGFNDAEKDPIAGFDDEVIPSPSKKKNRAPARTGLEYLSDEEISDVVKGVKEVISAYESPEFPVYLAGSPVVDFRIKSNMQRDMGSFMSLALFTIAIFLYILFRRLSGVILPLMVVILCLLSTFGFMALLGYAIKVPTQILPSFLLAVGVGDSVHILSLFYHHLRVGHDRIESIQYAMNHSGLAVIMTSLTTAGGLMSFITSDIAPVADLGIFAPVGVMLALFYSLVLLPALLTVIPLSDKENFREGMEDKENKKDVLGPVITWLGDFSVGNPRGVVLVSFFILVVSLMGTSKLFFAYNPLTWLPEESRIRKDTQVIDTHLGGTITLEVLLATDKDYGWQDPGLLSELDKIARYMEQYKEGRVFVGKASSVADNLMEIHQALNENQPEFRKIPENRELVAQEFLLFENSGSDDLEDVANRRFSLARFSMKLPALDAVEYTKFIGHVEEKFREVFGKEAEVSVTGLVSIVFRTVSAMCSSMANSYLIAFVVITFLMILMIGDLCLGIISMAPNLLPIIATLGIMGWLDIPLDAFTLLIGSIAIGLVVDDTIHFMHNFRRYYHDVGDAKAAIHHTLQTSGRAILFTSLVLSSGFFVFMLSSMKNLFNFGLLTGFTILMALLADFLLSPALMVLITKKRGGRNVNAE